jgi:hypothetical protein
MSEQEWLEYRDPYFWQKDFLPGKVSERQLRLFACACCRSTWHLLNERSRHAVEVAERYADEMASDGELQAARAAMLEILVGSEEEQLRRRQEWRQREAQRAPGSRPPGLDPDAVAMHNGMARNPDVAVVHAAVADSAFEAAVQTAGLTNALVIYLAPDTVDAESAQITKQSHFFSDIVRVSVRTGMPPQPLPAAILKWSDGTIPRLAQAIYDELAFDRLPILADALEEAGCTNADILAHCRQPGEHVRGCWAVDLILGKS